MDTEKETPMTIPKQLNQANNFQPTLTSSYNFELNKKIYLHKFAKFFLKSKNYITNELFRFGGINSIRGFAENSLQGNLTAMLLTEYRYVVSSNLYINSILDYAIYQDLTNSQNPNKIKNLTGIGIGTNIQTPNGLLKINLTNGGTKLQEIQLFNTIINICYNVKF